ncbi:two-component regulator propeller domain-containing protein [Dyadobacter sp. 32]|uniref:PorZ beta-propeller-like domain-containing protein n=1 Tax=Dyadobacter sp. 32 TaxID=538966 RepID=UPI0011ECDB91
MRNVLLFLFGTFASSVSYCQNVAIGEWEALYSYTSGHHVVDTGQRIFCATYNGLFSVNHSGRDVSKLSKADGLNDIGISSMAYDPDNNSLLVAYRNGNMDLLQLNTASQVMEIKNLPVLLETSDLPDDKRINQIVFHEGLAFLCSAFGIVVLDTKFDEIRETYRFIGNLGTEVHVKDLAFTSDSLFAVTSQGLLATSMRATVNRQYYSNWKPVSAPSLPASIVARNNMLYGGFPGKGIFRRQNDQWNLLFPSNSSKLRLSVYGEKIAVAMDREVLVIDLADHVVSAKDPAFGSTAQYLISDKNTSWIADLEAGLIGNPDGKFSSFSPVTTDTTITVRADSSLTDHHGLIWSRLPGYLGGGISITDKKSGKQRFLSASPGNGNLPTSKINSIIADTEGYIWFGSDKGVGYFFPDEALTTPQLEAILPFYGQRKLFNNERCTALAVEPGNRKWIGTLQGLYLFSPDGTELVAHYTKDNSPLPSDIINALSLDPESGVLFIDTPNGMVSYRTGSGKPANDYGNVVIFPNPVRPGYAGSLGIKGLTVNSIVKITTLSGRLVYETKSEGGTATWNLNDYTGRRAAGGIYIVMTVAEDKSAKFAGKFAVIDN